MGSHRKLSVILSEGRVATAVEGPGVASRDASMRKNMGAASFWRLFSKSLESKRITLILKSAQALLLAIAVCFSVGATDSGQRFANLGHRLMCTCGCAQLLGECNHVSCQASDPMRVELGAAIASGATNEQILTSFAAKYGITVLAAPPTEGFSLVAWIAPFAVFAAALLGTVLLIRHWSASRKSALATEPAHASINTLREKIRRETETSGL